MLITTIGLFIVYMASVVLIFWLGGIVVVNVLHTGYLLLTWPTRREHQRYIKNGNANTRKFN